MLVSFWSSAPGSSGLTTNMAAMAAFKTQTDRGSVLMFENHLELENNLESMVIPKRGTVYGVREKPYYYDRNGLEELMKIFHAEYSLADLGTLVKPLLSGNLKLLPHSIRNNSAVFEHDLDRVIDKLLFELQRRYDNVFVDTQPSENVTTKYILHESDVVVVNLRQDEEQFERFFAKYGNMAEKCLFLVSRYNDGDIFNLINISRLYGIKMSRLAAISEYPFVPLLCSQGRLCEYVARNHKASAKENCYEFIRDVRKATEKLEKMMEKKRRLVSA